MLQMGAALPVLLTGVERDAVVGLKHVRKGVEVPAVRVKLALVAGLGREDHL